MTRLQDLRRRLLQLKHRRQRFRWATGYSGLALALLWALGVAFPIDWYFQHAMGLGQRLLLLALVGSAVAWAFYRYTLPWLGQREGELDMALLVQGQAKIDSDLIAALQFESPEAANWGSTQLETAVIEQAAATTTRLDVMKSLPRERLGRRMKLLALSVAAWGLAAAVIPGHVEAFFSRIVLGSRHYPSRTRIESLQINGQVVDLKTPAPLCVLYGRPVRFEVQAAGSLPADGKAVLVSRQSGARAPVVLQAVAGSEGIFSGQLPRAVEAFRYQVFLGDAWTDEAELKTTQLPAVELEVEVLPPEYAQSFNPEPAAAAEPAATAGTPGPAAPSSPRTRIPAGMRQFSVMEGSQVFLKIRADRPLKEAAVRLDEKPYPLVRDAVPRAEGPGETAGPESWSMAAGPSPLASVVQPVRYVLDVTDFDQQHLEQPIEGMVRIQPDLEPRVLARTDTHYVLPTARPTIFFSARDDHALAEVWYAWEVVHGEKSGRKSAEGAGDQGQRTVWTMPSKQKPPASVQDGLVLDLRPLKLVKGDALSVTFHVRNFRGPQKGKTGAAVEPLLFQVTDEEGIFAAMTENDKMVAHELKTMTQRELRIGETP